MSWKNNSNQNTRSIRASKSKLTKALYASGMKTQTQLAEKIADNEGLGAVPKNLVSRVFTGKPVDPLSLERVTTALGVETHTVLLSSGETQVEIDDELDTMPIPATTASASASASPVARGGRNIPFTLAVAALAFVVGVSASSLYYQTYGAIAAAANDYTTVDFSFTEGKPPRGYGLFEGMLVSIDTMNMESVGYSIRDQLNTSSAKISLTFDEPIEYFRLNVSYVLPPDEFLTGFSLGLPDTVTDDLIVKGDIVTSRAPGDNGEGALIWNNLDVREVYFEIGNLPESEVLPALVIDSFGFRAVAAE